MRTERFNTQARLLTSTRQDGHRATALDTNNSFEYRTGFGWQQLVPVDGLEGQPLVATQSRTFSEFDTRNRLVPTAGTGGQLTSVDEFGDTVLVDRDVPGGLTYPVNFSDGSLQTFVDRVIPAGALGPNGFLRVTAICRVSNTSAGVTATIGLTNPVTLPSLTTANLTSTANNHGIEYSFLMFNQNDETLQAAFASIKNTLFVSGAAVSTAWAESFETIGAAGGVDTTADWQLVGQIQLSGTILPGGTAHLYGAAVEYGYAA